MEEEAPSLRFQMLRGPRQGETLEFRPGTAIRIGRFVRGNTLPIKDSGISSKHLSILTESHNWVLQDLDSSNGTVLDGTKIPPLTPFPLRDGSVIKIGEVTSILVNFLPQQNSTHVTQNPSRSSRTEPDPKAEGFVEPVPKPQKGKGKAKGKVRFQGIDEIESELVDQPASSRVMRNSRSKGSAIAVSDSENLDAPDEKVEEPKNIPKPSVIEFSDSSIANLDAPQQVVAKPKNTRATRNSKRKKGVSESVIVENLGAPEEKVEELKNIPKTSVVEVSDLSNANLDALQQIVGKPKNTRVTRNSKSKGVAESATENLDALEEKVEEPTNIPNPSVIEVSDLSIVNTDVPQQVVAKPKNTRVTRSSKNKQNVIGNSHQNPSLECVVKNLEKKNKRGRKKLQEESVDDGGKDENEDFQSVKDNYDGNEKENLDGNVKENLDGNVKENLDGNEKENLDGNVNVNGDWPDLEKMSLGEWFDFLEVHLPKRIIDETEGMIDSMREKAERLREYIIMQESNKVQMPVE